MTIGAEDGVAVQPTQDAGGVGPASAVRTSLTFLKLTILLAFVCLGIACTYRFGYPGWTFRGFVSDLKAIATASGFALPLLVLLWRAIREKSPDEEVGEAIRRIWQRSSSVWFFVLIGAADLAGAASLMWLRPPSVLGSVLRAADQSDWPAARSQVKRLHDAPFDENLVSSAEAFVQIHEDSENYQNRESRAHRQLLARTIDLLSRGIDPDSVNMLSQAEAAKIVYFVEENPDELERAFTRLQTAAERAPTEGARARLLAKAGELQLTQRKYDAAIEILQRARSMERDPTRQARIEANIGTAEASLGRWESAVSRYTAAEHNYPQGRRFIFYSNLGYILMHVGRLSEARDSIQRALGIKPDDWYSYLNLALVLDDLKEPDAAAVAYRRVIQSIDTPDAKREAQVLAGRSIERAGGSRTDAFRLYLAACGKDDTALSAKRSLATSAGQRAVYQCAGAALSKSNVYGIEGTLKWFEERAAMTPDKQARNR